MSFSQMSICIAVSVRMSDLLPSPLGIPIMLVMMGPFGADGIRHSMMVHPLVVQLAKSARDVSKFAVVFLVDAGAPSLQTYLNYFDVTLLPATLFFFNAQHMKMDCG